MLTVALPLEVVRFAENQGLSRAPDGIEQAWDYWIDLKLAQAEAIAISTAIDLQIAAYRFILAGNHSKTMLVIYGEALDRLKAAIDEMRQAEAAAHIQGMLDEMAGDKHPSRQSKPRNPQPKQKGLF